MIIKSVKSWGTGSQCIPIPKTILKLVGLEINDEISIELKKDKIIISPIKKETTKKE